MASPYYKLLKSLLVASALLQAFLPAANAGERVRPGPSRQEKTVVQVTNNLEGQENLEMHCKDANLDYGIQQVPYGEMYSTDRFYLWGNADVFCSMAFSNVVHWFDLYLGDRDNNDCGRSKLCRWTIKEAGPCMIDPGVPGGVGPCFPWNKKQ